MEIEDGIDKRHRATYILELGTWRATCKVCGFFVTHPLRRRAASIFRSHIRDMSEVLDLRSGPPRTTPDDGSSITQRPGVQTRW